MVGPTTLLAGKNVSLQQLPDRSSCENKVIFSPSNVVRQSNLTTVVSVDSLLAWAGLRYYAKMRIQCRAAAAAVAYCADEVALRVLRRRDPRRRQAGRQAPAPPARRRCNSAPVLRRLLGEGGLRLLRGGQGVGVTIALGTDIAFDKVFGLRAIPTSTRRRTEANIRGGEAKRAAEASTKFARALMERLETLQYSPNAFLPSAGGDTASPETALW
jgi:hypothetical protein